MSLYTLFLWWLKRRLWLVDLKYNTECDQLFELSDNNLATELVENRILKLISIVEIVIFTIKRVIVSQLSIIHSLHSHSPQVWLWRGICILLLLALTDFFTSTEFSFWNYKSIKTFSIFQTKHIHSCISVSESFTFVFAARRTRSFLLPERSKRNGEILKKIRNVLQERKLLPNRDWKIKNSWEKEHTYHNLKVYANFRSW